MKMKCAGEIMLPMDSFPFLPYWFTLRQALAELEDIQAARSNSKYAPWTLLVFTAENQFLGIVQRQSILRGIRISMRDKIRDIYPSYSNEPTDPELSRISFSQEKALHELRAQLDRQIIEFMTPIHIAVDFNDPALFAVYLMIEHSLAFVPVAKAGQIVGIVYIEDALHEVITHLV
jgi:CBS-domain-containing membrane protein